jgi:hypothetical protein
MGRRRWMISAVTSAVTSVTCLWLSTVVFALPEGRHYEMVSPLFKGGYSVKRIYGVAMSGAGEGDRVAFVSVGSFADTPNNSFLSLYLARRSTAGWSTESIMPPASTLPNAVFQDLSPTLESALFSGQLGQSNGFSQLESPEGEYLLRNLTSCCPTASFSVAGMPVRTVDGQHLEGLGIRGSSPNFCHIVFEVASGQRGPEEALLPEAFKTESFLYDLETGAPGCGAGASLKLLSVSNELGPNHEPKPLDPYCRSFLGTTEIIEGTSVNAISNDGRTIFFESNANLTKPECGGNSDPPILFVRLDGQRTVEVSTPIEADCQETAPCHSAPKLRAEFLGANQAGTRAFFTTVQPLVTSDTDTTKDLYMAEIGCPAAKPGCAVAEREVTSFVQVSHDPNTGEAAEVQGPLVISADGSHAYFVARGVLGQEGPTTGGAQAAPVEGADNLYVYDANVKAVKFVADLCSGPDESGVARDSRCPAELDTIKNDAVLWGGEGSEPQVQTTLDGRFLLFTSYGQLVAGDTDAARDVYRYDAQTGMLDRVSIGEAGFDANGNGGLNAQIPVRAPEDITMEEYGLNRRAISEDGSRVVFETAEPLSPKAVNGLVNAYEWHEEPAPSEGVVSLVSTGSDPEPVGVDEEGRSLNIAITPLGNDIFFTTAQGLSPQDTDGAQDIYDARTGTGFPPVEAQRRPCSGDACQGPLTNPAPLLVPGSVSQAAGEDFAPSASRVTPKKKPKKLKRGKRRGKRSRIGGQRAAHAGRVNRKAGGGR